MIRPTAEDFHFALGGYDKRHPIGSLLSIVVSNMESIFRVETDRLSVVLIVSACINFQITFVSEPINFKELTRRGYVS